MSAHLEHMCGCYTFKSTLELIQIHPYTLSVDFDLCSTFCLKMGVRVKLGGGAGGGGGMGLARQRETGEEGGWGERKVEGSLNERSAARRALMM